MLTLTDLRIPHDAQLFLGADTGTFMSAALVAISGDHHAFVLAEWPNYRYVSDQCELNNRTTPEWATEVVAACALVGYTRPVAWLDPNSQFKSELRNYGLHCLGNKVAPEARVSIAREYFLNNRVHLAPWLRVLPYELEHAKWPDEATAAGRFMRSKRHDHTLDCLEHVLSRRPRGIVSKEQARKERLRDRFLDYEGAPGRPLSDPHMGRH